MESSDYLQTENFMAYFFLYFINFRIFFIYSHTILKYFPDIGLGFFTIKFNFIHFTAVFRIVFGIFS